MYMYIHGPIGLWICASSWSWMTCVKRKALNLCTQVDSVCHGLLPPLALLDLDRSASEIVV